MVFKLKSRWPETRVCCPKTLCSGHLENKGVVGTLPGIDTQGSYVAVVFKLHSRWPETTVCCPKTLCSGHLENKGLVATTLFPGMARHQASQTVEIASSRLCTANQPHKSAGFRFAASQASFCRSAREPLEPQTWAPLEGAKERHPTGKED